MDDAYHISGARVEIEDTGEFLRRLREIGERTGVRIVCLNREMIAGLSHARAAIEHAMRAFEVGRGIASSLEMEVLLYAAATRQCSVAIAFGIREGVNHIYLCLIPPSGDAIRSLQEIVVFEGTQDDPIDEERRKRLMRHFGITMEELEAVGEGRLPELVCERVALLDVYK